MNSRRLALFGNNKDLTEVNVGSWNPAVHSSGGRRLAADEKATANVD